MISSKNIDMIFLGVLLAVCALSSSHELGNSKCIDTERRALLNFKKDLIDEGNYLSSWIDGDEDCCTWTGVFCHDQTHNVYMLYLDYQGLDDRYRLQCKSNCSLLELPYLTSLILNYNRFKTMPKFVASLSNLTYLDMSYNGMIDPPNPSEFDNLKKLSHLELRGNKLTKFPPFIFSMSKLEHLDLSWNSITESVPQQLGNLSKLTFMDLSVNGAMKINNFEWVTNLSSLTELSMETVDFLEATNWLNSIKSLPSLKILSLSRCHFPDPLIPSSFFPRVNASNSIQKVYLEENSFSNQLLPFMFNISSKLIEFSLHYSEILNGKLPEYSFNNMTSLEVLDLSGNQLVGGIPKSFDNLCSIRKLDLSNNTLSGLLLLLVENFSKCSQNSSKLESLYLYQNNFEGILPDLSRLTVLKELLVSHNNLNGLISDVHLNLSKLSELDLSMNSLVLNITSDWIPPFQLFGIHLRHCEIGPKFPGWLQTQKSLTYLDISNSNISDILPIWFWSFSLELEFIDISFNRISGEIPNLPFKFDSFPGIDLSFNLFHGPLPKFLFHASMLNLSKNKFKGSLRFLCNSSMDIPLSFLDLSYNQLYGELPDCWMHLKALVILNLESNSFSGKIPVSMGSLDRLETLHLRKNGLSGNLPSSLQNCNKLKLLDLGENKLSGEVRVGNNLTNLIVLRLRSNGFNGSISSSICHLTSIQILDLSFNNISGRIPTCLNNFTAMLQKNTLDKIISSEYDRIASLYYPGLYTDSAFLFWKGSEQKYRNILGLLKLIDLSSNQLIGNIPEEVTSLLGLITLNLSRNNLVETIPKNIGNLTILESLDLSENQLSGEIPISLADLTLLSYLDLSSNDLSGRIPLSTQLQSFNASQYMGNPGLCGVPLPRKCPGDEDPHVENGSENNMEEEDEGWFDITWVYAGAGSGFFTGFWVVFGTLLFIKKWRHAYFRVLYDMNDWMWLMIGLSTVRLKRRFSS